MCQVLSATRQAIAGVRQGSIPSPILFIIFTRYMFNPHGKNDCALQRQYRYDSAFERVSTTGINQTKQFAQRKVFKRFTVN